MRIKCTSMIQMKLVLAALVLGLSSGCAPVDEPTAGADPNFVVVRKLPSGSLQTLRIMENANYHYNATPANSMAQGLHREGFFEQREMEKLRPLISKIMGMERSITNCKALHVALPMVSSDIFKSDCFKNNKLTLRLTSLSVPDACIEHPSELSHCDVQVQTLFGESQRLFDLVERTTSEKGS